MARPKRNKDPLQQAMEKETRSTSQIVEDQLKADFDKEPIDPNEGKDKFERVKIAEISYQNSTPYAKTGPCQIDCEISIPPTIESFKGKKVDEFIEQETERERIAVTVRHYIMPPNREAIKRVLQEAIKAL